MEEEEIEMWYEEQKQKLSELYIKSIEKGMKLEDRERKFNKAMERLTAEYNKRHAKLDRKKKKKKENMESRSRMMRPFTSVGHSLRRAFSFLWVGLIQLSKAKYAHAHYRASMFRIHYGYKITDPIANALRPVFYWYVRYVQQYVLALTRPFVRLGRFARHRQNMELDKENSKKHRKNIARSIQKSYRQIRRAVQEIS